MNVIFIHHSCFLVEVDEKVLIFDWFSGDRITGYTFGGRLPEYEPDTPVYVFASHKHRDHFDMDILRWSEKYNNIHYILSKDCKMTARFLEKHGISPDINKKILYVAACEKYRVDDINIETLKSTDAGVAFYVETNGACLYHAGDLNNWKYEGAGDLNNGRMDVNYKMQIKKLATKRIHLAFVPLDPGLGQYQSLGMEYFIANTDADYIFPMHMWQDYSGIARLKRKLTPANAERIVDISEENQTIYIQEI